MDHEPDDLVLAFFRPTEGALQLDGTSDFRHYWWLSWEWENLYLACPVCIRAKGQMFPTESKRCQPDSYGADLQSEKPLLLDPCLDNPFEHLVFRVNGEVVPLNKSQRGQTTINILNLNRDELVKDRSESAWTTNDLLQRFLATTPDEDNNEILAIVKELKARCAVSHPHAGVTLQLLAEWLKGDEVLKHPFALLLSPLVSGVTSPESNVGNPEILERRTDKLNVFFDLGDDLVGQEVRRAFLSVDVVGSVEMKKDEHQLAIEQSFNEFRSLVDAIMREHHALQSIWGGDGLMTSYDQSQRAVDAAIKLLQSLPDFNRAKNRLRKPFQARCGINSGELYDDPLEDLERKTSPVIDRAGHLQKQARPNCLLVGEGTIHEIDNKGDFHEFDRQIDEQRAWEYCPNETDRSI